jgi:dTDP-4-amino-4,6-dideoxygalactose transaminase
MAPTDLLPVKRRSFAITRKPHHSPDRISRPESSDAPAIAGGAPIRSFDRPLIFGSPVLGEAEIASVSDCLRSRWIGVGARVEKFQHEFARYKGAPYAAAVSSGTAAIHLALVALGIGAGDEVIAPTMTFCSTVHSIVHTGAKPALVDCQSSTFNIDPDAIKRRITSRTKAIIVVHMCGRCCDMEPILKIARKHNLRVIEDCAHAIESNYHGNPAGLMGDIGCFSFYPTKNMTTGDGGMVITRSKRLFQRVKTLSLHGITADAWTRYVGGSSGYKVLEAGFKYNMTDIAAALGLPQLEGIEARWARREKIWRLYADRLKEFPLILPPPPEPDTRHAYHLYTPLLVPHTLKVPREKVIAALRAENILAGIHFVPVHLHPYYRQRFRFRPSDFPNASMVGMRTLSLPLTPAMSGDDVSDVCTALQRIFRYFAASTGVHGRMREARGTARKRGARGVPARQASKESGSGRKG